MGEMMSRHFTLHTLCQEIALLLSPYSRDQALEHKMRIKISTRIKQYSSQYKQERSCSHPIAL